MTFFANVNKNNHVKQYLEKNLEKYAGIDYAYFLMNKRNIDEIVVISSISKYFDEVYLAKKHQRIDPVIINALNRVSPIIWDENLMINSQWTINKIFNAVKPFYNIVSGQTFVLHDYNNNLVLLSLYINKYLMVDVNEKATKDRHDLQGLLIDTHEMMLHLYRDESERHKSEENMLSSRENEILYWSSTGKTYPEIAHMLNITVSTVKFHMGKIVKKMGVNNAKHAISLAIELNIISHPAGK
ncbi:LuxR family transcriptional regulator [Pantoea sp. At-9b]|uniref:helix-turn-helix transcriptional regulator n=1 Tax=Pantoea sp. (strain At-9b) TaxID=592316 RepID=UPI0001B3E152|nr:LuxR family transcriptional regulator [Pantoea sp. At-9b]ADU71886.1 ATP-dependent transcriptional regulator, MalT-like, LuxR family [Pantoea sp. At-9b]